MEHDLLVIDDGCTLQVGCLTLDALTVNAVDGERLAAVQDLVDGTYYFERGSNRLRLNVVGEDSSYGKDVSADGQFLQLGSRLGGVAGESSIHVDVVAFGSKRC